MTTSQLLALLGAIGALTYVATAVKRAFDNPTTPNVLAALTAVLRLA